ncbi:MAG: hypothetical protein J7L61_00515, partial [Thermoplasmata archaeon]|nr:hypothetical protein [Thermoplasmata archaeon]
MEDFETSLLAIAGIGPARLRALLESGYDSPEKIREAAEEELASVPGISPRIAAAIKKAFTPAVEEEEEKPEIFLCPECGAFISREATECPFCGTSFEEGEEEPLEERTEEGGEGEEAAVESPGPEEGRAGEGEAMGED